MNRSSNTHTQIKLSVRVCDDVSDIPIILCINSWLGFFGRNKSAVCVCMMKMYCIVYFHNIYWLTLEIALGAQVADGQPQYGQPVQLGQDVVFERQQVSQRVQLGVQPFPVPLARVTLAHTPVFGRRFHAKIIFNHSSLATASHAPTGYYYCNTV